MPAYWWLISPFADWALLAAFVLRAPVWLLAAISLTTLASALAGGSSGRGPSRSDPEL